LTPGFSFSSEGSLDLVYHTYSKKTADARAPTVIIDMFYMQGKD